MKSALATAFVAFVTAVSLLTYHYKTEWVAPNFVTHSSTFDWLYQVISSDSSIKYSYSETHDPLPIVSSNLVDLTSDEQTTQEKQSSLYHLLHIPPWALVPDRITAHQGTVAHLYDTFDTISQRWKDALSYASDNIDVTPTKSLMRSHMESLSKAEKYWIKNISEELFNVSQLMFSYQMLNYADEIEQWIQNSQHTDSNLRFHFERTRGWPLLYNIFQNNKIRHNAWETQLHDNNMKNEIDYNKEIDSNYFDICTNIIESFDANDEDSENTNNNNDNNNINSVAMSLKECEVMLDLLLPWLPDRSMTLSAMWPNYENILGNLDSLREIEGVNSSFTQVIKQNHRPSSDVPLHYVSVDGKERIRVEWFINDLHYRATNIAFVRRIRYHIKRMTSALRISIGKEDPPDADDWEAFFAQYDPEYQPNVDPRTQQLDTYFVDFLEYFCNETEKGQFDKVLSSDLSQDLNIFFHGLPSITAFRDNGLKKAWNMIVGVWDKTLINFDSIDITDIARANVVPNKDTKLFMKFYNLLQSNLNIDQSNVVLSKKIALEIVPVWPYTVGGWLRAQTPELPFYSYPDHLDSVKYEIKRCVLLLDVIVQIYVNNMRGIGDNKFLDRNNAKLITLQSILQYISNYLVIQHTYFYNEDLIMFPFDSDLTVKQGVFVRLASLIACNDINGGIDTAANSGESLELNDNIRACLLSGVMFNIIDGFVRENEYGQHLMLFLNDVGVFKQVTMDEKGNKLKSPKIDFDFEKLFDSGIAWKLWQKEYFGSEQGKFDGLTEMIAEYYSFKFGNVGRDNDSGLKRKRKKEDRNIVDELFSVVRNIPKYSIVSRPGEDSYVLDEK